VIHVRQKIYKSHKGKEKGDCLRACVASILHKQLEDVPHFIQEEPKNWKTLLYKYMASQGYRIFTSKRHSRGFNIACGPPIGCTRYEALHAVVASGNRVVWSPNFMPIRYAEYYHNISKVRSSERKYNEQESSYEE